MLNLIKFLFNFFAVNKLALYAGIAALVITSFFGWLWVHDNEIRKKTLAEFNAKQEEIYKQRNEQYNMQIAALRYNSEQLKQKLDKSEAENDKILQQIMDDAGNVGGGKDPAPIYLKSIVNGLDKQYGVK